jgi:hypothetical protein
MMTHHAIVAFFAGFAAILCGLLLAGGVPIALTVAFERARERAPRARPRHALGRNPYR